MLSKPILTQLPCQEAFSLLTGPYKPRPCIPSRRHPVKGRGQQCMPQDGALPLGRESGQCPGLKLLHGSRLYERADSFPPALTIPSERGDCAGTSDPAGRRGGQGERRLQGCPHARNKRLAGSASQRPHYNQLEPNEETCNLLLWGGRSTPSWGTHQ